MKVTATQPEARNQTDAGLAVTPSSCAPGAACLSAALPQAILSITSCAARGTRLRWLAADAPSGLGLSRRRDIWPSFVGEHHLDKPVPHLAPGPCGNCWAGATAENELSQLNELHLPVRIRPQDHNIESVLVHPGRDSRRSGGSFPPAAWAVLARATASPTVALAKFFLGDSHES